MLKNGKWQPKNNVNRIMEGAVLFPVLEVNPGCQADPLEWFQDYFILFVLLTTELFWEDWGERANLSGGWWLCDLAGSWCAIAQGHLPAFPQLFQSQLTTMICVCDLMEKERQKQTLHSPHSPISLLTHKDWFLPLLMVWHSAGWWFGTLTVCGDREGDSSLRKEGIFYVCSTSKRLQTWGGNCWFWVTLIDGIKTIFKFTAL